MFEKNGESRAGVTFRGLWVHRRTVRKGWVHKGKKRKQAFSLASRKNRQALI